MVEDRPGEEPEVASCADCGAYVSLPGEIAYTFGYEGVLCLTCAVRRGGAYDAADDRWVTEPRVDDLVGLLETPPA